MKKLNKFQRQLLSKNAKAGQLYEFSMDFIIEDVNKKIEALGLPEGEFIPASPIVEIYNQQDLIIALKLMLIKPPELWVIGSDAHFYNAEKDHVLTIPGTFTIPNMSFAELMGGCDHVVDRGDGFKVKGWKGANAEIIANWEAQKIPPGYVLVHTQCRFTAQARFNNLTDYQKFNSCLHARNYGFLLEYLK